MRIGVPKEIKNHEYRVGLVPHSVSSLVRNGHQVLIEAGAGSGAGLSDDDYRQAGADVFVDPLRIFDGAELIVKVKEPQAEERKRLKPGQILFTYLHLAPDAEQTRDLLASGAVCFAYETVTSSSGGLPLLTPMSEVAGRLAPQVAAHCLERAQGGRGVLMGGVPGVAPANVVVVGCGVSGQHACDVALGMGANVTAIDSSAVALRRIAGKFGSRIQTAVSTPEVISQLITQADVVIGAVLVPGATAPKIITRDMLKTMKQGAVIVDIAIDQGGCTETSRPTTHSDPTYIVDGIVHYCVANMPGAVARTSTFALNNVTLPFILAIAGKGWRKAIAEDPHLRAGLNIYSHILTNAPVAEAQGREFQSTDCLIN